MKKSELVKKLQEEIDKHGDEHLRYVEIREFGYEWTQWIPSPTRKNRATGEAVKMSHDEHCKYNKENPIDREKGR